jgi:hypothetical protein
MFSTEEFQSYQPFRKSTHDDQGIYILENTPHLLVGGELSTDVIREKNIKMEEKKGENVREKIERGKKMRKLEVKG